MRDRARGGFQLRYQFRHRDISLRFHSSDQLGRVLCQLAVAGRTTLASWFNWSGRDNTLSQLHCKARTYTKVLRRFTAGMTPCYLGLNPFSQLS
jgi:hypothetical protein